ncbi:MAG: protein kinase [Phycisphaerales bacterium]|nr:protein kinase [Phycisphaerales bacterium]
MASRPQSCPIPELIEAFANGEAPRERRLEIEQALESNPGCRELFRQLTEGKYPQLPNYTIIDQIGKGGFGVVYKAVHHEKERVEALKVLFGGARGLATYFENEVHLIAKLRHPNIATLFDAQLTNPPLYYTMEFVAGERLNDYIRVHEVSLARRIEIIRKVALAMSYAHAQGVVHRDLKPQNILIDNHGEPHIVDFGIAMRLDPAAEAARAPDAPREGPVGTVGYIAPEQAAGKPIDARADVYALGALLFHCVTGEPARFARDPRRVIELLRERRVAQPEDLASIILHCVENKPEDRYADCRDFADDLDRYVQGNAVAARGRHPLGYRISRLALFVLRNHPTAVYASVLAVIVVGLTYLAWSLNAEVYSGFDAPGPTYLVGYDDKTRDQMIEGVWDDVLPPAVEPWPFKKRRRALFGLVLKRMVAVHPKAVALDFFMPDAQPTYDPILIDGIEALQRPIDNQLPTPVIVGAARFDVNSDPAVDPAILAAAHGYGALVAAAPASSTKGFEVAHVLQRGVNEVVPGLALATFAAGRQPDADAEYTLEDFPYSRVQIRFRRHQQREGERRFLESKALVRLEQVRTINEPRHAPSTLMSFFMGSDANPAILEKGDRLGTSKLPTTRPTDMDERIVSMADVLSDEKTLRKLKAAYIVLGETTTDSLDRHLLPSGETLYGCEVHLRAIDALVNGAADPDYDRSSLMQRTILWVGAGWVLVFASARRSYRRVKLAYALLTVIAVVGVAVVFYASLRLVTQWQFELALALGTMMVSASLTYMIRIARDNQLLLAPASSLRSADDVTLPSTILAETR